MTVISGEPRAFDKLKNGAMVLHVQVRPGPAKPRRWVVMALWQRNGQAEYCVWDYYPDNGCCEQGDYTCNPSRAWQLFSERSSRYAG